MTDLKSTEEIVMVRHPVNGGMPAPIAQAISAVMGDIKKIGKENTNTHGGYDFASIDDFLDELRPACAKHGLVIMQEEDAVDTLEAGTSTWLRIRYGFTLHEKDGMSAGPFHRTAWANTKMGPQALGAAQSYAFKNFARSLFQISTGDIDIDHDGADMGEPIPDNRSTGEKVRAASANAIGKDAKAKTNGKLPPMWKGPLSPVDLTNIMESFRDDLPAMDEADTLISSIHYNQDAFDQCALDMPKLWAEIEPLIDKQKDQVGL